MDGSLAVTVNDQTVTAVPAGGPPQGWRAGVTHTLAECANRTTRYSPLSGSVSQLAVGVRELVGAELALDGARVALTEGGGELQEVSSEVLFVAFRLGKGPDVLADDHEQSRGEDETVFEGAALFEWRFEGGGERDHGIERVALGDDVPSGPRGMIVAVRASPKFPPGSFAQSLYQGVSREFCLR